MSEEFKVEIVNPEKLFFSNENAIEVVIPAFEGEMGILKDHISIISFLKPGVIKFKSKNSEENFYVEDGIVEFKDNSLSILTSLIFNLKETDKTFIKDNLEETKKVLSNENIDDQSKFLAEQKLEVLNSIN